MAYPVYNNVFDIPANTDPVAKNKGVLIVGSGSAGSAKIGFFDSNGETGSLAGGFDGLAGITATVPIAANSTVVIPVKVGNVGALSNCTVKGLV